MDLNQLHFAHPLWLCLELAIPLVWAALFFFFQPDTSLCKLEKFIDKHLIPHLLIQQKSPKKSIWKGFLLWSFVWTCLTLAMAGPRWDFREIETFSRDQKLVILLDLSKSMNAEDIKPSRLVRAKQKIEDLINNSKGIKIGLVAFAADPHMIVPITEDLETIRHLLPSIDTDLVHIQGSRLSSALDMAAAMFMGEPGQNKTILIISDGGFEDASAITSAKNLANSGIHIYSLGVGTIQGIPLKDIQGNILKKNGVAILSKLEKEKLSELSKAGNGRYLEGDYSNHAETILLTDIEKRSEIQKELGKTNRLWDEGFYFLLIPIIPLILLWFRHKALFPLSLLFLTSHLSLDGDTSRSYFMNSEEFGQIALENSDYERALQAFQDPYRKGVACYKAGNFAQAESFFRESNRQEVASQAAYNLGNALTQQQKFKEAIAAYEKVLEKWPDHSKAKDNLELVKKMLEEQEKNQDQQNQDKQNSDSNSKKEPNQQEDNKDSDSNSKDSQNNDQNSEQNSEGQENSSQNTQNESDQKEKEKEKQASTPPKSESSDSEDQEKETHSSEAQANPESQTPEDLNRKCSKSQEDQDADLWLDQIDNDPKSFLKNKFYLESQKNKTAEGMDPW